MADQREVIGSYTFIVNTLIDKHLTISTMESCTGGGLVNVLTNINGSSKVISGSVVTYSNSEKIRHGVPAEIIEKYSVYSRECSKAMAEAVIKEYSSDIGVGVTGNFFNVDPQNEGASLPGRVYYSIAVRTADNDILCNINEEITLSISSESGEEIPRHILKIEILEDIARKLKKLLLLSK